MAMREPSGFAKESKKLKRAKLYTTRSYVTCMAQ
jgi:hypothetical protein